MLNDEDINTVCSYYSHHRVEDYDLSIAQVNGWGSEESQEERYRLLTAGLHDQCPLAPMSILDVGCGTGEAFDFISCSEYVGVDLSPAMISLAKDRRGGLAEITFIEGTIDDVSKGSFDSVICSGALTLQVSDNPGNAKALMHSMYQRCTMFAAINFLHDKCDYQEERNHHYNTQNLLGFAESIADRVVKLESTTLPWEVTLQLWRAQ